jgi:hypothetical protein
LLNQLRRKVVPHRNEIKLFQVRGEQSLVRFGLDVGPTAGGIGDPAVWKRRVPMEKVLWFSGKVPDLIAADDQCIEGVGYLGQLRLCFAKRSEGKGVATKVVKRGVEFMSVDEASETVRKLGPATEVVAQARPKQVRWGLMIDDLDIVAQLLKGLSQGKTLEQSSKVIPVVECEYPDFHKKIKNNKRISEMTRE